MNKILILHAYGDKNIGDAAIVKSAVNLLKSIFPLAIYQYTIMGEDTDSFKMLGSNIQYVKTLRSPYGLAIRNRHAGRSSNIRKIVSFFRIYFLSILYFIKIRIVPKSAIVDRSFQYIKEIKDAKVILSMGGGYLLTKNKYKDYFGLMLTILPHAIAKLFGKKIIFLPASYGPFAAALHETITYQILKGNTFFGRDILSMDRLIKKDSSNSVQKVLYPDLALYLDTNTDLNQNTNGHRKNKYIVLTAREWLPEPQQIRYENELASFIYWVWHSFKLKTVFVPMAYNDVEDDDRTVGNRLNNMISAIKIFEVQHAYTPQKALALLKNAKLSICTRMHSAILSTISNTPFITISYLDKTLGFMKHYGLEKWNIPIEQVTASLLAQKVKMLNDKQMYSYVQNILCEKNKYILKTKSKLLNELIHFSNAPNYASK